jgi:hypothetical protein
MAAQRTSRGIEPAFRRKCDQRKQRERGFALAKGFAAAAGIALSLALLLPAQAQFWDWGGRPQRYQRYDPFREFFGPTPRYEPRDRERSWSRDSDQGSGDFSHAPGPGAKKPEATTSIVVMGDANADWLAYGLEDAFSEKPEIGIVRKHRTDSGLIRYDARRDSEWAAVAREIIAAEKPKFIVMMIGNNDRQWIREKAPPPPPRTPGAPGTTRPNAAPAQQQVQQATPRAPRAQEVDPEQQPPESPAAEQPPATPEQARAVSYGPWEFHTEKWEIAYIKRVDATIAALKSAGVPVIWVGLPSQRATKASSDSSYLNEIYRSRADKAGITYVDVWDGFVDEGGRFSPQGPDYEGQIRRLRTGDGVYFTKYGARKLAHYVEREIQRHIANRAIPVALPAPADAGSQAPSAKPGAPAARPAVGPVVPLTAMNAGSDELLGGGRQNRPPAADAAVTRVLTKGEPVAAPNGRADDFSWPRAGVNIDTSLSDAPVPAAFPGSTPENPAAGRRQRVSGTDAQNAQGGVPASESRPRRPRNTGEPFRMPSFFPFFR